MVTLSLITCGLRLENSDLFSVGLYSRKGLLSLTFSEALSFWWFTAEGQVPCDLKSQSSSRTSMLHVDIECCVASE